MDTESLDENKETFINSRCKLEEDLNPIHSNLKNEQIKSYQIQILLFTFH